MENIDQIDENELSKSVSLMVTTSGSGRPMVNESIDEVFNHYYNKMKKIDDDKYSEKNEK